MRICSSRQHADSLGESSLRPHQRQIIVIVLKWVLTATVFGILTFFTVFGIDFNSHVSLKEWISPVEVRHAALTCFSQHDDIPKTKKNGIIPSVPVVEEFTCFDFASTLKPIKTDRKTLFHTFYDAKHVSDKHLDTIRSFLATQNLNHSQLVIWTLDSQKRALLEKQMLPKEYIDIRDGVALLNQTRKELIQLASLYKYGGVWFDMEVLFIRDMSPLLTQEWISEGGCKKKDFFNGVVIHFYKESRYLCEMMEHYNAKSTLKEVYRDVYYRLLENKVQPFSVLPWCYTDPSNCLHSLPSAFKGNTEFSKSNLQKVFAFHYQESFWSKSPDTLYKYLVNQHKNKITSF